MDASHTVTVLEDVLDANSTIAQANRDDFDRAGVTVVNLMSAPGAGKTSLLEAALRGLDGIRVGVLEGDVQTTLDADRIASLHMPVTQITTDPSFGGECHLDANMVRSALPAIPLDEIDLLIIENVGNLVCPAEFRVGEDHRAMVSSVAEGEDKPLKYPLMFRVCDLVIVNKIDLLDHLEFDLERSLQHRRGPSRRPTLPVSARDRRGGGGFRDWLAGVARPPVSGRRLTVSANALTAVARPGRRPLERRLASRRFFEHEAERVARFATAWRSASPAAGGWWRSASRRRHARTCAT